MQLTMMQRLTLASTILAGHRASETENWTTSREAMIRHALDDVDELIAEAERREVKRPKPAHPVK